MNFGKSNKAYDSGRHEYPAEVMNYIFSFIKLDFNVLDLGCGTGIATRQLKSKIDNVRGCDIDEEMIKVAKNYRDNINCYITSANKLPFNNNTFDALFAFGAFHWFCDENSVTEIRRVLKEGGFLVVVNKNDIGNFKQDYQKIIEEVAGVKLYQSIKAEYRPISILSQFGFSDILERKFLHTEEFTISRALEQAQSMSLWNMIPENKKQTVLEALKKHFEEISQEGIIYRQLEITVVSGGNKA